MLRKDIDSFLLTIPKEVTLVAATKYVDVMTINEMIDHHIFDFGENRVDSFLTKYEALKNNHNIRWHFIGHLQRNKAKQVLDKIDYLHSLDSLELANMVSKYRKTPLKVFVEISINLEETKNGVPYYEASQFIEKLLKIDNIELVGLMMMAVKNSDTTYEQFAKLKDLRDKLEKEFNIKIPYLSMGMSDDYLEAIKAGATHIRLGRILYDL